MPPCLEWAHDQTQHRAGPIRGHPCRCARAMRQVSGRILARARPRAWLPHCIRRGIDGSRLPRGADPGRIWRQRARHQRGRGHPGGSACRRLQWRRVPRPDVHHGYDPAARQCRAEAELPAQDRQRRIALAGLRRHRADLGHRHAVTAHHRAARGQRPLRHQRPETLDLARGTFRSDAAPGAHRIERKSQEAHRRALGVSGRYEVGKAQVSASIRSAP